MQMELTNINLAEMKRLSTNPFQWEEKANMPYMKRAGRGEPRPALRCGWRVNEVKR